MKISNFIGAKNQFTVLDDSGNHIFQSYDSIICKIDSKGHVYLDEKYWDYSRTTGKYRNMFLDEGINETREKIKNGKYTLTNLNK